MQAIEPLSKAKEIEAATHVPIATLYAMERAGLVQSYRVGLKRGGVRFRLSEVIAALAKGNK